MWTRVTLNVNKSNIDARTVKAPLRELVSMPLNSPNMPATKRVRPERKKPGAYHHGNLREALLQAAVTRIAASQDFDFRLRDLAADCGVRLAASYRHFASKSDVMVELARRGFAGLREALSAVDKEQEPAAALTQLGAAYIEFAEANPVSYLAMFHPALKRTAHPELDATALETLLQLRAAVIRVLGRKHGDARTVDKIVLHAWAGVHGYASLLVSRDPVRPNPLVEQGASKRSVMAYTEALTAGWLSSL
jgi:AcrR family transcriptional regulator